MQALNNVGAVSATRRVWKPPARRVVPRGKINKIK